MHPLDIHWIYSLGSVALVAAFSFVGMLGLAMSPERLARTVPWLVIPAFILVNISHHGELDRFIRDRPDLRQEIGVIRLAEALGVDQQNPFVGNADHRIRARP